METVIMYLLIIVSALVSTVVCLLYEVKKLKNCLKNTGYEVNFANVNLDNVKIVLPERMK